MSDGDLYTRIAADYDALFPAEDSTVRFLLEQAGGPPAVCLDAGCGTGSYVQALLDRGTEAYGTDVSERMIAESSLAGAVDRLGRARIRVADLFATLYGSQMTFDLVYSIGNTISHLPRPEEAHDWAGAAMAVLKRGGALVVQYVEATDLAVGESKRLPTLEGSKHQMERTYRRTGDATAEFDAVIVGKSPAGEADRAEPVRETFTTNLCVIDTEALTRRLCDSGYAQIEVYGGFSRDAANPAGSWVMVVTARRPSQ